MRKSDFDMFSLYLGILIGAVAVFVIVFFTDARAGGEHYGKNVLIKKTELINSGLASYSEISGKFELNLNK